jgi:hypothetical protein
MCNLATKVEGIWLFQLNRFFPTVTFLPKEKCMYSIQEQFQIHFKRVSDHIKPFCVQIMHELEKEKKNQDQVTRCKFAIGDIPRHFNDQEEFEESIQAIEVDRQRAERERQMKEQLEEHLRNAGDAGIEVSGGVYHSAEAPNENCVIS